jgi:hypothetical protein
VVAIHAEISKSGEKGSPNIQWMSEPATHHEPDNQDDNQDACQAYSSRPIVAAAVSVKPTSAKKQNQQDN